MLSYPFSSGSQVTSVGPLFLEFLHLGFSIWILMKKEIAGVIWGLPPGRGNETCMACVVGGQPSRRGSCKCKTCAVTELRRLSVDLTGLYTVMLLGCEGDDTRECCFHEAPKGTSHKRTIAHASLLRGRCRQRPTSACHSGKNRLGKEMYSWCQACPLRRETRHEVGSARVKVPGGTNKRPQRAYDRLGTSLKMVSESLVRRNEKETAHARTHPIRALD
ncbi:hypothetical protein BGY98DRAFT_1177415 [Russula aff. rugulosa BPL654]|nr:hypothetical protein BGY98DRAFT_1177415 [Russula aff. rugulosa BPL654]